MRTKLFILILLVLGLGTRFIYFGAPAQVVFDEVYFAKYAVEYTTGNYYFDPHPPLGKLLLGIGAALSPEVPDPATGFSNIGQPYQDPAYLYMRFLPTLLGGLLPLLVFFLARKILKSEVPAFVAGLLTVLETLFIVQSRFVFIDVFLVFFGLLSLLFYFIYRETRCFSKLVWAIVFASAAISVKWTGLSYIGLIGLVELYDLIRLRMNWKAWLLRIVIVPILFLGVYLSAFAIHFALLPLAGEGDVFMTSEFQKTLIGNGYESDQSITPITYAAKFKEIHKVILDAEKGLEGTEHSYGSEWYTWPLMQRPVYYWVDEVGTSRIYLFGNVLIYWLSTVAIGSLILLLISRIIKKIFYWRTTKVPFAEVFIVGAFLANWLPFMLIHRVMFIYHYFAALIFAYIALAYLISRIEWKKGRMVVYSLVVFFGIVGLVYFMPLVYGLPLDQKTYDSKVWLKTWL